MAYQTGTAQHVSTHSRPKAAATLNVAITDYYPVSTHSRAEAAANGVLNEYQIANVSTHSRAEAAAFSGDDKSAESNVSTHSRAEAAASLLKGWETAAEFQHTAARRRLPQ